jgi:hypothetical protein
VAINTITTDNLLFRGVVCDERPHTVERISYPWLHCRSVCSGCRHFHGTSLCLRGLMEGARLPGLAPILNLAGRALHLPCGAAGPLAKVALRSLMTKPRPRTFEEVKAAQPPEEGALG